jgi:hypothetical protein
MADLGEKNAYHDTGEGRMKELRPEPGWRRASCNVPAIGAITRRSLPVWLSGNMVTLALCDPSERKKYTHIHT